MRKIFIVFALLLAGCQTTGSSTIGSGPITLSSKNQNHFENYLSNHGMMFAVAIDGRSGMQYYYCPTVKCRDRVGQRKLTIDGCEKRSNGVTCKIYAIRDRIVWDFDAPGPTDPASSETDESVQAEKPSDVALLLRVTWIGYGPSKAGWLDVRNDLLKLQLPSGEWCAGQSRLTTSTSDGSWSIDCPNGTTATGDYSGAKWNEGLKAKGYDVNGNFVTFWRADS